MSDDELEVICTCILIVGYLSAKPPEESDYKFNPFGLRKVQRESASGKTVTRYKTCAVEWARDTYFELRDEIDDDRAFTESLKQEEAEICKNQAQP